MCLTARESRRRLSELDVAQTDILQGPDLLIDRRMILKEIHSLINAHVEDIRYILSVISDFKSLAVISLALADVACDVDIGKEVHLDLVYAVSRTGLTASALRVERESSRLVASLLCIRCLSIELADEIEKSDIRCRITPRSPSYRTLVYADDLIKVGISRDTVALDPSLPGAVKLVFEIRDQR